MGNAKTKHLYDTAFRKISLRGFENPITTIRATLNYYNIIEIIPFLSLTLSKQKSIKYFNDKLLIGNLLNITSNMLKMFLLSLANIGMASYTSLSVIVRSACKKKKNESRTSVLTMIEFHICRWSHAYVNYLFTIVHQANFGVYIM